MAQRSFPKTVGAELALHASMKNVSFRPSTNRSGFIESFITPVNRSETSTFGFWQGFAITALIFGTAIAMRLAIGT